VGPHCRDRGGSYTDRVGAAERLLVDSVFTDSYPSLWWTGGSCCVHSPDDPSALCPPLSDKRNHLVVISRKKHLQNM
jgi:hypothetical protein